MSGSNAILTQLMSVPLLALLVERLRQIPTAKLRASLLIVIVFWLLLIVAEIIWVAAPIPHLRPLKPINNSAVVTKTEANVSSASQTVININKMKEWMLFGAFAAVPLDPIAAEPTDLDLEAKETRLSLKLLGIMQSSDPKRGHAIIQYQSQSELYAVGDPIPISRGVTLSKVLADRVIIDNAGNFESIFLWDEETQKVLRPKSQTAKVKKTAGKKALKSIDHRNNAKLTKIASDYKQKLLSDPMSMADVMRISPSKSSDGSIQGYRVSPGRDRANFKSFGLKSGDVITAVNGIDLSNQANAMKVYQDLSSATEASFDLLRRGEPINLIISLE